MSIPWPSTFVYYCMPCIVIVSMCSNDNKVAWLNVLFVIVSLFSFRYIPGQKSVNRHNLCLYHKLANTTTTCPRPYAANALIIDLDFCDNVLGTVAKNAQTTAPNFRSRTKYHQYGRAIQLLASKVPVSSTYRRYPFLKMDSMEPNCPMLSDYLYRQNITQCVNRQSQKSKHIRPFI